MSEHFTSTTRHGNPNDGRSRRRILAATGLVILLGSMAGCASGGTKASDESASRAAVPAVDGGQRSDADSSVGAADIGLDQAGSAAAAPRSKPSATPVVAPVLPPAALRLLTRTGTVVVRVAEKKATRVSDDAVVAINQLGGSLYGQKAAFGDAGRVELTFKVPPDQFDSAVRTLGKLGRLVRSDVATDDVTATVVDLDARIRAAEASVERVRTFLSKATSLSEVTSLEAELTNRETTLEQLAGQRRQTVGAVEAATLSLVIETRAELAPAPKGEDWLSSVPGFGSSLRTGWNALASVVRVALAGVGYGGPLLAALLAPLLVVRAVRRRLVGGRTVPATA